MTDPNGILPPAAPGVTSDQVSGLLQDWIDGQRWFAGKNRERGSVVVESRTPIATVRGDAVVEIVVFAVEVAGETQRYQLWIGWHPDLPQILAHARIGEVDGLTAYDALHDSAVAAAVIRYLADGTTIDQIRFRPEDGAEIDVSAPGQPIGVEQSNTSVVYGHSSILKVFRRLEPGPNPDVEVHRALQSLGGRHIATPLAAISGPVDGQDTTLALHTSFFAGSAEGWAMATTSVRDLIAEADLRADEVGGDFADESRRLGRAVAEVHADLAEVFGVEELPADRIDELIDEMVASARAAADLAPVAAELPRIVAAFEAVATAGKAVPVQRIHGDLHLGQTLRVLTGWAILDFEGEPSKPLAYRRDRHSPLRDVAGMLRSYDYAAFHWLPGREPDPQLLYRSTEWAQRNRTAFCEGYAAASGTDPRDLQVLLTAFELDKAVYEVVYEYGHRPAWTSIPVQAITRILDTTTGGRS